MPSLFCKGGLGLCRVFGSDVTLNAMQEAACSVLARQRSLWCWSMGIATRLQMMFALLRDRHTFARLLERAQAGAGLSCKAEAALYGVQAEVVALLNEEYGFEYMEDVDWEDVLQGDMQVS